jgi:integrase
VASVRRKVGSKYWFACFTLAGGSRVQRSTKETDRKKAQRLADTFEQTAKRRGTARQAQRLIAEIFEYTNGDPLPSASIRSYFESWLARKKGETAPSTFVFYRWKIDRFLAWLGERASHDLFDLASTDVLAFRTSEALRVSPSTVNHGIKILRMVFEDAKRDGNISDNPAETVRLMKRTNGTLRRPFTLPEIKKLLAIADAEWRSLIVFGLYTGQRLGDVARLK